MLRAHRQAWAWQDEWYGLTMEDVRKIEKEVQEQLARKMAANNDIFDKEAVIKLSRNISKSSGSIISSQMVDLNLIDKDKDEELRNVSIDLIKTPSSSIKTESKFKKFSKHSLEADKNQNLNDYSKNSSNSAIHSPSITG